MISKRTRFQLLLVVSLSLYVISVFQPWIIEKSGSLSDVTPSRRSVAKFWSFQLVWDAFRDNELVNSSVLRFQEYWFAPYYSKFLDPVYIGWLLVFAFQIFTVIAGILSLVRVQIRDQPFPLVATIGSILSVAFGVFQLFQQQPPERIIQATSGWTVIYFTTGFFLAVLSAILWGISFFIYGDFE